jgi:uncharacterized protein (TIGR01777 family)
MKEVAMRVIITGGTGLIGRALTASLAADGHGVIILSRTPDKAVGLPTGTRAEKWDSRTAAGWGALADGADVIVNLAGESIGGENMSALILKHWTPERKERIRSSRVNAGQAVMQAIQQAGRKPRVLIQASAVGYYGLTGDKEITEDSPAGQDALAQVCVEWEATTVEAEKIGVRRAVIRTGGVVMSTHGGALPFMLLPFKLFVGGPLGSGRQWFSWIHIADQVRAIRFLIESPQAEGAFNLCAPQPLRNADLSRVIGKVLRRPMWLPMPAFAMRLLLGEKSTLVLDGQRQLPKRLLELGFQFGFPDVESALRDLVK